MKKTLFLLSTVLTACHLCAFGFHDAFTDQSAAGGSTYSVGATLDGQNDGQGNVWNGVGTNSATAQPTIIAGNLNYPQMPDSIGGSVSIAPGTGRGNRVDYNNSITLTDTRAYYSYYLKVTDLSSVSTSPSANYLTAFADDNRPQGGTVARAAARLVIEQSGSGYVVGMGRNSNPADNVYDTTVHNVNETVFVVGSYDRIGGVTNVNLWVNPDSATFGTDTPPAPTVSVPNVSGAFTGDINNSGGGLAKALLLVCNAGAPSAVIDEMRIGTNWSFITAGDPAILVNPTNHLTPPGNTAVFTTAARGSGTLTYQWYKDSNPLNDGGNISGATTTTLTVSSVSAADEGSYYVIVLNGSGNPAQSASATLQLRTDPLITGQPQDVTTNAGSSASFQVTATGTAPFSYQWHKQGSGDLVDGPNISGSQSNIITLSNLAYADGGQYYVTVHNSNGDVDSDNATLTVLDPFIVQPPLNLTTNAGATASFHVVAGGTGPFTYVWFKGANLLFDGGNISGSSTDTLIITNAASSDQASYHVTIIGTYGQVDSPSASLTVLSPASIAAQPRSRAIVPGARAVFSVTAAGSGPFTYQWQRDSTNIPGATSTSYIIPSADDSAVGSYQVVVSNAFSGITSSAAMLTVSNSLSLAQTNLVVIRIGDGAQSLTLNGNSMFLDQFDINGNYIDTITIPEDGPNGMVAIGMDNMNGVNSGPTTGSGLSRSLDGRFMVIAGYNTNLNYGAGLNTSPAAAVPRAIGLIDSYGQYAMPVADTSSTFSPSFWRCGVTDGTNNYWGSANITGTYYFGFDAAPAVIQNTMINMRSMALFNGDIYCVEAANPTGVLKINGMPETATTPAVLFSGSTGSFDLTVSPDGNLIYVTDQRNVASGGGIQRWQFDGSNWTMAYTLNTGFGNLGPRYIAADFSGADPVLYVTSNDQSLDNNRIIKVVDTGAGSAGVTLAYAGANQTFRGIRFGPVQNYVAPRPVLSFSRDGSSLILNWTPGYTLQSSTNVSGTYQDVPGATSPYTNNIGPETQRFFRLRN